jgi:hypothetical protein
VARRARREFRRARAMFAVAGPRSGRAGHAVAGASVNAPQGAHCP